jgi:predicted DNA-binding WGR domain protein
VNVRRFEHPSGKFWSIDEAARMLTVRWGAIGTAGQRRDITVLAGDDPRGKLRELVAKQLALGYVEVMNAADIVATIREIWFGRGQYNGEGHAGHLTPIYAATGLPALRHLGICNCEFSLSAIEGLLASPLLPQLRSLDLSSGIIAVRELEVLLANADKLGHLTSIDVSENYLDEPQVRQLQRALPNVVSTEQRELDQDEEDDDDYRYAALGE